MDEQGSMIHQKLRAPRAAAAWIPSDYVTNLALFRQEPLEHQSPACLLARWRVSFHCPEVSVFTYATIACASSTDMRNGGMGGRSGLPLVQIPVVSSIVISASVPGGVPAIRGTWSGQLSVGWAGSNHSEPPCSHLLRSRRPWGSRGV